MIPFTQHSGKAVRLAHDNIDTDQIIPSREMKSVSKTGLKDGLFAGWRYTEAGSRERVADFPLNAVPDATIIISGKNFGCGSSREHAVWALKEFGIRAVLAEGFGEIFYGNCVNNGVAAITLPKDELDALGPWVEINLVERRIVSNDVAVEFSFADADHDRLVRGLDAVGMTLELDSEIAAWTERDRKARGWAYI